MFQMKVHVDTFNVEQYTFSRINLVLVWLSRYLVRLTGHCLTSEHGVEVIVIQSTNLTCLQIHIILIIQFPSQEDSKFDKQTAEAIHY